MRHRLAVLFAALALASPLLAQSIRTPPAGSAERRQILDAIRPHIERDTGAPVEFVVRSLKLSGEHGFAALDAQRPGGRIIDLMRTPLGRAHMRSGLDAPMIDCCHAEAVLRRVRGRWTVLEAKFGSTDVWYEDWCRNRLPKGLCDF